MKTKFLLVLTLGLVLNFSFLDLAFSQVPRFVKVKVGTTTAWKDLASGLIIGKIEDHANSLQEAQANCPAPWRAPSFGDPKQFGASGDLAILFKDAVLSVYPELMGKSFWVTDALSPYYETIEFVDDAEHPIQYNYGAPDGSISSICITK